MKTRAAVLYEAGQPLVVEDVDLAEPRDGEVLVRIAAAGVCHSDLHFIKGDWPIPKPAVLGHEGSAIVERVGPGVRWARPGDHCVLIFRPNCGRCAYCVAGRPVLCIGRPHPRGTMFDGTTRLSIRGNPVYHMTQLSCFAQHAVIPEEQLLAIDQNIPLDRAALVGCAVMTGVGATINTAPVEPGSRVVVIGCGGVGLNVIQGARMQNAARILAVDLFDGKLALARQFGATDVINARGQDPVATIREWTDGGADVSFDAIGTTVTVRQALDCIRPGGTAVIIGLLPVGQDASIDAMRLVMEEKTLRGSLYGSSRPRVDMLRLLDLYAQGRLKLDELISRTYTLDQINEGFRLMEDGAVARGVIIMS